MTKKPISQNPSPAPASNPWNKGAGPVKGEQQSGTSTPKEKAPEKEAEGSTLQQHTRPFNADEVKRMFDEDAKKAMERGGPDALVRLPDDGKAPKQAWGRKGEKF
jgi:hypothetical protein